MTSDNNQRLRRGDRRSSHMPETNLYEKVIPIVLVGLGALTVILILVGLGIAFGIIPY